MSALNNARRVTHLSIVGDSVYISAEVFDFVRREAAGRQPSVDFCSFELKETPAGRNSPEGETFC